MHAIRKPERQRLLFHLCFVAALGALLGCRSTSPGQLFSGDPCITYGCSKECDPNWQTWFTYTDTSMTLTSGDDCRSVKSLPKCVFDLGDGGVTEITFDFDVADGCHPSVDNTEWLSFWLRREPPSGTTEVDFLESTSGPSQGLNTNFDGNCCQVVIFEPGPEHWVGSIRATFSGTGDSVKVEVHNSVNSNVGTRTLPADDHYYFVMDTDSGLGLPDCTLTISNLRAKGSVASPLDPDNCAGLIE